MQPRGPLEIIEYRIEPRQHIAEWFQMPGELGVYLIESRLDVEIEGYGIVRLAASDFVAHPASLPHRWHLVDDEPARALLAIAHASEGASGTPGHNSPGRSSLGRS